MAIEARDETASTTSLLRVMNERAVFERIRQLGPVSRPQLAAATGLSKPTISLALANDDLPLLAASVIAMAFFVVLFNRAVWKRLAVIARERFQLLT